MGKGQKEEVFERGWGLRNTLFFPEIYFFLVKGVNASGMSVKP